MGKQSIQLGQSLIGEGLERLGPMTTHDEGAAMRPANKGAGQMVRVVLVAQEVVVEYAALEHEVVDQVTAALGFVVDAQSRGTRRPGVVFVEFRPIQFQKTCRNAVRGRYVRRDVLRIANVDAAAIQELTERFDDFAPSGPT